MVVVLVAEDDEEEEEEGTEVVMAEPEAGPGSGSGSGAGSGAGAGAGALGVTARAMTASGHGVTARGGVDVLVAPYIGMAVDAAMGVEVGEEDMLTGDEKQIYKEKHEDKEKKVAPPSGQQTKTAACVMKGRLNGERGQWDQGRR